MAYVRNGYAAKVKNLYGVEHSSVFAIDLIQMSVHDADAGSHAASHLGSIAIGVVASQRTRRSHQTVVLEITMNTHEIGTQPGQDALVAKTSDSVIPSARQRVLRVRKVCLNHGDLLATTDIRGPHC